MRNILGNILRKAAPTAVSASLLLAVAACGKAPLAAERPVPPAAPPASQNAAGSLDNLSAAASSAPQRLKIAGADNVSIDGGSDSYAHINYAPAVKMFDEAEVRSTLMGISSDGHGFLFKNASESIRSLKAGDVLMIKNKMAIKVLGVTTSEDQTLVLAGQPSLLDLAQDGEININAPVRFHGPKKSARLESAPFLHEVLDLLVPPAYAQSGLQGSTTDAARQQGTQDAAKQAASAIGSAITDGWTVAKWTVVPGDGQADIDLVLTKSVSGFVAMVSMKGWIGNFDFASKLNLTRGAPAKLFQGVKNMQGNLQFDWEIGKSTSGGWSEEDRIKLPGAISVPLGPLLGGMPLTLDISSALLIHPDLTAGNEYSRGGFAISWGGNGTFESKGQGAVSDGNTIETTFQVTSDTSVSAVAPNAMVISYCAPRIELRFDVLGPFATSVADFGSNIDKIVSTMEKVFPKSVQDALAKSPLSKVTASNILSSNADVYVQFIATEGVTHAPNTAMMPCSKQEIKLTAQGGTSAQFFGLTEGAKGITDLFTKTFTRWDPASDYCKSV